MGVGRDRTGEERSGGAAIKGRSLFARATSGVKAVCQRRADEATNDGCGLPDCPSLKRDEGGRDADLWSSGNAEGKMRRCAGKQQPIQATLVPKLGQSLAVW